VETVGEALKRMLLDRTLSNGSGSLEELQTNCCLCGNAIVAYRLHTQAGRAYTSRDTCEQCTRDWVEQSTACKHCGRQTFPVFDPVEGVHFRQCERCDVLPEGEREKRAAYHRWEYITPPRYREFNPALCPCPSKHAEVMGWRYSDVGLLLRGPSGLGKTTSLFQLLRRLLHEGRSVVYLDSHKLAHTASTFAESPAEAARLMEKLTSPDVLAFDDVGKAIFTERMLSELFGVIERRTANKLPILVTTNESDKAMIARMKNGETAVALLRRIREFTTEVVFQ
jgi:DNA replication protein DnaC